jgi:phenylpropionate dioxygenase-like ring-hydroxylating dioxygenase large terminal subunit
MDNHPAPAPGIPKGWYAVACSEELSRGEVIPLKYFDQELVLFRTASGEPVLLDAYCPHLGTHLGYGGQVEDDVIRCPFHGWRFSGLGQCVDIPYCEGPIPRVKIKSWPIRELTGLILAYHDQGEGSQPWELTGMPDADPERWRPLGQRRLQIQTNNQDVVENFVDAAHFTYLHGLRLTSLTMQEDGPLLHVEYRAQVKSAADELTYVPLTTDITCFGLGITVTTVNILNKLEMQVLSSLTPVDPEHIDALMQFRYRALPNQPESVVRSLAELAMRDLNTQLDSDARIWAKKKYLQRPVLCQGDGPIMKYRQWARRFYLQPAAK